MLRKRLKSFLPLFLTIFTLFVLPTFFIESLRVKLFSLINPAIKVVHFQLNRNKVFEQNKKLEAENQLLRTSLQNLKNLLSVNCYVSVDCEPSALAATVIYRDPSTFANFLWLGCGEETNKKLSKKIIDINSPVLMGRNVIGAIDYVGKKQSRVRLITDPGLKVAVKVASRRIQDAYLSEQIDSLTRLFATRKDIPSDLGVKLTTLKEHLQSGVSKRGAKGLLFGSGAPLWRKKTTLKGVGFNWDFPEVDEEHLEPMPIKEGDLLITSGLDGVFPEGLLVAQITQVNALKEGSYTYDLEASPMVTCIEDLKTVFVIPACGMN